MSNIGGGGGGGGGGPAGGRFGGFGKWRESSQTTNEVEPSDVTAGSAGIPFPAEIRKPPGSSTVPVRLTRAP